MVLWFDCVPPSSMLKLDPQIHLLLVFGDGPLEGN